MNFPAVLDNMASRERWVLWRYYTDADGKRRKLPYDLNQLPGLSDEKRQENGKPPVRTGTLAEVRAIYDGAPSAWEGVGYVPDANDSFACLDFDALSDSTRDVLNLWHGCRETTYCEFSPSGNGGHAIVTLRPHAKERLRGIRNLLPCMELYSDSGFFTVTGRTIADRSPADFSNRLVNLADRLNLEAVNSLTVPTLTHRPVAQIEIGRIYAKIERWPNAQRFLDMRDSWEATSRWAPRGNHGPDRSQLMIKFVSFLVRAGARDPDLLWAIIKKSAVWREGYSRRENADATLWASVVPLVLRKQPPTTKPDGPAIPTHLQIGTPFSFPYPTPHD